MEAAAAVMAADAFDAHSEVADALSGFLSDPSDASRFLLDDLLLLHPPLPHSAVEASSSSTSFQIHPSANASGCGSIHPSFSAPSSLFAQPTVQESSGGGLFRHWPKRHQSCGDLYGHRQMPAPERRVELSAQSTAARARRKRIAEKMQELGRLIPGGNRMTTAEMLQAATGYVKFMQAQVALLGLFGGPIKDWIAPLEIERRTRVLMSSTQMQEMLAAEGRCVVPKEVVMTMAEDDDIKLNLAIARDLTQFIELINIELH
ncbi:uncharacterized protein LOC141827061 [Curcuma longa]|uniref:uncharacterized protein LOC141827061 n=1 Tax=Curcuma longa TaxID=136217 RepID=UPI003D9F495B